MPNVSLATGTATIEILLHTRRDLHLEITSKTDRCTEHRDDQQRYFSFGSLVANTRRPRNRGSKRQRNASLVLVTYIALSTKVDANVARLRLNRTKPKGAIFSFEIRRKHSAPVPFEGKRAVLVATKRLEIHWPARRLLIPARNDPLSPSGKLHAQRKSTTSI